MIQIYEMRLNLLEPGSNHSMLESSYLHSLGDAPNGLSWREEILRIDSLFLRVDKIYPVSMESFAELHSSAGVDLSYLHDLSMNYFEGTNMVDSFRHYHDVIIGHNLTLYDMLRPAFKVVCPMSRN